MIRSSKRLGFGLTVSLLISLLAACAGQTPQPAPTPAPATAEATAPTTAPTDAPAPTAAPAPTTTAAPTTPPSAGADTLGVVWSEVDCDTFNVAAEIIPNADCGYVRVPESRAAGTDRTIELAVVRLRSGVENAPPPVFLATGGPGSNGLFRTSNIQFVAPFGPILAGRDWVFFSQRGTQHARPQLDCLEYKLLPAEAARNGWTDEERRAQRAPVIQACAERYAADGVNLSAFNSDESAADIDSIRQVLGYEQIVLYGQSYGTQLTQFVMRNHPDILATVILDGVVPVAVPSESEMYASGSGFREIFASCAADPACSTAYPDAEAALREAYTALEASPQPVEVSLDGVPATVNVDGTLAVSTLFSDLYAAGEYAMLPYYVTQLRAGNVAPLVPMINDGLGPGAQSILMHLAINCTDDPNPDAPPPGTNDMYLDANYDDDMQYVTACAALNVERLTDRADEPVVSDIPTLILNGAFDPVTPPANGDRVAEGLSNSFSVVFSTGTHINGTNACGVSIINAFLGDPTTAPDATCAQQPLAFGVPQTVTVSSADGSTSLSVTLPPGFKTLSPGVYADRSNNLIRLAAGLPAGLDAQLQSITAPFGGGTTSDGEPVAGLPSRRFQLDNYRFGNGAVNLDGVVFGDEAGTFFIFSQNQDPSVLSVWRGSDLPAIVRSAVVSRP